MIFGIRPEALTDPDGADRNASSVVEGDCLIDVVEPAGSDTFAVTRIGGKQVVARLRADARISAGQRSRRLSISTRPYSLIRKRRRVFFRVVPANTESLEMLYLFVLRASYSENRFALFWMRFKPSR